MNAFGTEMQAFLLSHEATLRMAVFLGLLAAFWGLETALPRRRQRVTARHAAGNLAFAVLNGVLLRLVLPGGLAAFALLHEGGGLMGRIGGPLWLHALICLVLLDLTLYGQHRLLHKVPLLWRLHAPHHGDRNLNVSSAVRFHPAEALFSTAVKAAAVWLLGAPAAVVILFELLLNGASLFNHANWSLGRADRLLQKLIVTPDMHRLHHSRLDDESRCNFGFFLTVWDRLFGSYRAEPHRPHDDLPLGLEQMPEDGFIATLRAPLQDRL